MKRIVLSLMVMVLLFAGLGCRTDANVASYNLAKMGEDFQLNRRVVFYNGITGEYMLTIEGRLSIEADGTDNQLEVTVKTSAKEFKKHTLGLSDNVTYFCEQLEASETSVYRYKVVFKPSIIVPDIDLE